MNAFLPQSERCPPRQWTWVLLIACLVAASQSIAASVDRYWEVSPYRIKVLIDYRLSHAWNKRLEQILPEYIQTRATVTRGPLWKLTLDSLPERQQSPPSDLIVSLNGEQLADVRRAFDKLIVLILEETPTGFSISAQEYDCLVESWGQIWRLSTRNAVELPELAFQAMCDSFTAMATFKVIREDPTQVELRLRGAQLPRTEAFAPLLSEGDLFQPVLRRFDRTGQTVEGGIQTVPWTYLTANPADDGVATAKIVSHTRMPLGVRQRGRVDQIAQLVRPGSKTTRLRLHARDNPSQPLAGFRVYQRNAGADKGEFIGKTDDDGSIIIASGEQPIQVAFVQSSGQWIAKIPLVPGADGTVKAPLVDDRRRQEAEAKLVGIREDLIDFVARRNILAMRARMKLKENDIKAAEKLVAALEDVPTATEFEQQRIRPQERLISSNDPRVQQRITKMFSDTRDVLAEFLSPSLPQEVKREVIAAGSAQSP